MNQESVTLTTILWWIGQTVYFYLPAVAANMAPVVAAKFDARNKQTGTAIRSWYNHPIFETALGANKTWRGVLFGILAAGIVFWAQKDLMLSRGGAALSLLNYQTQSIVVMAVLFGGGAMAGDSLKSFFKRRIPKGGIFPRFRYVPPENRKYPENSKWQPFDQLDFIIGATALTAIVYFPGWHIFGIALFLAATITPGANYLFYKAGWKRVPY